MRFTTLWNYYFFRGRPSKRLNHYILPTPQEDQPSVALLHISSNDINNQTEYEVNIEKLTKDIINVGKCRINFGVKEIIRSSLLSKNNIAILRLIRQVSDSLRAHFQV